MQYTRDSAIERLLESYKAYYNISLLDETRMPLRAVCEFYEHSEKFVISKKAELWSADCEEFIYLFDVERLTAEIFAECRDYAKEDGLQRANIHAGHMYTYITPVFVCDECDDAAKKMLKKCRIYKSFKFSFHGWMDFHAAVFETSTGAVFTNHAGRSVGKVLRTVLFPKKNKQG